MQSQAHDNYQYGFTTGDSRHSFMQLKVDNTAHNKHSIVMMVMMTMRMVMDDKKSTYLIKFIIVTKSLTRNIQRL